ncbi:hypothetical protein RB11738 [Rhodopirellula baltica SH 1]|uniref:Uncharacterized protein n=1 Tax=Rhodopirellula baltica (strain DSM 10527 / NCIMB 13988 / SH1) TaxID=243090 RepID=Q7UDW5_RHOBA|nr:hypothetical protein RB11738 [Rhodopirellula baltica SH 1]
MTISHRQSVLNRRNMRNARHIRRYAGRCCFKENAKLRED